MILEQAAYFLDDNRLDEAKCDNSIPNAVNWVLAWLARSGRGKDPQSATGTQTHFNNAHYYASRIPTPDYNTLGQQELERVRQADQEEGVTRTNAEYQQIKQDFIRAKKEEDRARRAEPHDQTMAESIVEQVVGTFSHDIDYAKKGWAKMFIQAFTRIALTECDFMTSHPDRDKIAMLKKCYLTATMMWKADKNQFGDDCNMQGISYNKLVNACKPHHAEARRRWEADKAEWWEGELVKRATLAIRQEREANGEDVNAPIDDEVLAAKVEEIRALNDGGPTTEPAAVEEEETPQQTFERVPVEIPAMPTTGPYANIPNPYMENSFRVGHYNCTEIHNFQESSTWVRFTNRTPQDTTGAGVSWCITYGQGNWSMYGCGDTTTVYYCWTDNFRELDKSDFPAGWGPNGTADTEWGRSLICVMITGGGDENWCFKQCTSRYNHGDGQGLNNDIARGGDCFLCDRNTVTEGARNLAALFGVTPEEIKAKLKFNGRVDRNHRTANDVIAAAEDVIRRKDFERGHRGMYINHIGDSSRDYILSCQNKRAIIINNEWLNNTWYLETDVLYFEDSNQLEYVVVRNPGDGESCWNILNRFGEFMYPDDFAEISSRMGGRFIKVRLNRQEANRYNLLDLTTRKLLFKNPVYDILTRADHWDISKGIPVILNPEDGARYYDLVNLRGKSIARIPYGENVRGNTTHRWNYHMPYDNFYSLKKVVTDNYMILRDENNCPVVVRRDDPNTKITEITNSRPPRLSETDALLAIQRNTNIWVVITPDCQVKRVVKHGHLNSGESIHFIPGTTKIWYSTPEPALKIVDYAEDVGPNEYLTVINTFPYTAGTVGYEPSKVVYVNTNVGWRMFQARNAETGELLHDEDIYLDNVNRYPGYDSFSYRRYDRQNGRLIGNTRGALINIKTGAFHPVETDRVTGDFSLRNTTQIKVDDEFWFTIKYTDYPTVVEVLLNPQGEVVSDQYYGYIYIGGGLFCVHVTDERNSKVKIMKQNGELLFDGEYDKLLAPINRQGFGKLKKGRNEIFFNIYGDVSRNLEQLEESVKTRKSIKNQNKFFESVAYLC